jgi:oligopeptide/dipeptide ABC transporter ATP-binding protein
VTAPALVEVDDLAVRYRGTRRRWVDAVRGVHLAVGAGTTLGLVGESGSGKSSLGAAVLGLVPVAGGTVRFGGVDVTHLPAPRRRRFSARLQVVFQDPHASLDPARTVGDSIGEGLRFGLRLPATAVRRRVADVLDEVGLPASAADRHPGQFSGGQRQRIAIARAIAVDPEFVVCDEPLSALDLSVQAQMLNLLVRLQAQRGLGYLFISHDLAVVRHVSDEIAVMFAGRIVEQGPADDVARSPAHPYTRELVAAAPVSDPTEQRRRRVERRAARPAVGPDLQPAPGAGCPFASRCPHVIEICRLTRPELVTHAATHTVACHRHLDPVVSGRVGVRIGGPS